MNTQNKSIMFAVIFVALLVIPLVSAQMYFKQNTDIDLKRPCFNNGTYCSGSATCKITIIAPDQTLLVNDMAMTNQGSFHNYSIISNYTSQLGAYPSTMTCCDGGLCGSDTFEFFVTGNGNEPPSGIVIVLFIVVFLAILGYLIFVLLYSIGHIFNVDFDIIDLAWNWGGYFALLGLLMVETTYLGNPNIHDWLLWGIYVGAFTNFVLPIIALFLSVFIAPLIKRRKSPNG